MLLTGALRSKDSAFSSCSVSKYSAARNKTASIVIFFSFTDSNMTSHRSWLRGQLMHVSVWAFLVLIVAVFAVVRGGGGGRGCWCRIITPLACVCVWCLVLFLSFPVRVNLGAYDIRSRTHSTSFYSHFY